MNPVHQCPNCKRGSFIISGSSENLATGSCFLCKQTGHIEWPAEPVKENIISGYIILNNANCPTCKGDGEYFPDWDTLTSLEECYPRYCECGRKVGELPDPPDDLDGEDFEPQPGERDESPTY